jgi:pyruvate dehydrogenase (quinone)
LQGIRVTSSAKACEAWRAAFSVECPTLIEAIVDAAVPLLPPNMPDEKADTVFDAVSQEPDSGAVRERIEQHLQVEKATR